MAAWFAKKFAKMASEISISVKYDLLYYGKSIPTDQKATEQRVILSHLVQIPHSRGVMFAILTCRISFVARRKTHTHNNLNAFPHTTTRRVR